MCENGCLGRVALLMEFSTTIKSTLMYKKILLLACSIPLAAGLWAQSLSPQVVASSGSYGTGGGYSLSWTVGEMAATTTLSGGSTILTQGFQQPTDVVNGLLDLSRDGGGSLVVYPVPATDHLWYGYEWATRGDVALTLHDVTGRDLGWTAQERYESGRAVNGLDCSQFAAGSYVMEVRFTSASGEVRTLTRQFQVIH